MNQVDILILHNKLALKELQPTLKAKVIPFRKIGLYNTARKKEKRINGNLVTLDVLKTLGKKELPNDMVELLDAKSRFGKTH